MKRILIAGEKGKFSNYEKALNSQGFMPDTSLHVPDTSLYAGLVLPGGEDIDPKLFGQLPEGTRLFDPVLDRLQMSILNAFVSEKKPVLGICKGMQLINIYFGGDMIQHLPSAPEHEYREEDQFHETRAVKGCFLEKLYGETFVVNSAHHQGVNCPGRGIEYVQFAGDGVIEGMKHGSLPVFGVQWHPERLCGAYKREGTADGGRVFREIFLTGKG